ncbi:MAG: nuclear transport factor 2 family protein [Actinomycetota bacterium]|nr:nuclear transport factor 2 family protein [Actinomycetota bacterium]
MGNLQIVESIYAAMAAKDPAGVLSHLSEQVTIYQDPRLPWGGNHVGHHGFAEFALALTGAVTSSVRMDELYESDDRHVVQCGHTIGTVNETGAPFDVAEMHLWTLEDGMVVATHFAIDTAAMLAALDA